MTDVQGLPPTTCGSVDADTATTKSRRVRDLLATARDLARLMAEAADALTDDELALVASELKPVVFAGTDDPVEAGTRTAAAARLAGDRLGPVVTRLAGRVLQAERGPGFIVPSALPAGSAFRLHPFWASAGWAAVWRDRLPPHQQDAFPIEWCLRHDGRAHIFIGPSPGPAVPLAEAVSFTRQARALEDERDAKFRAEEERVRAEAEFNKREARRMRYLD